MKDDMQKALEKMLISDFGNPKEGWYGEWVIYEDDSEVKDAILYLELWKRFLLRKMPGMEEVSQDFPLYKTYESTGRKTLGIKVMLKRKENE